MNDSIVHIICTVLVFKFTFYFSLSHIHLLHNGMSTTFRFLYLDFVKVDDRVLLDARLPTCKNVSDNNDCTYSLDLIKISCK